MNVPRTCVAVLEREVAASLERVWENVLDWEHLPWLHRASFSGIELLQATHDGWSARVQLASADGAGAARAEIQIEVCLDRPGLRYVTRTLAGPGAGSEIWTVLAARNAQATGIHVEFHLPGVAPEHAASVGVAYRQLYTRLWDEDEAMMRGRQAWLDRRRGDAASPGDAVNLGPLAALRARLPLELEARGRRWRVLEHAGELVAHASECPHRGGPLGAVLPDAEGRLVCPWHGYRFDLRSGRSCDGRPLALGRAASVRIDPVSSEVLLCWAADGVAAPDPSPCAR